jgi:hypothetical protein
MASGVKVAVYGMTASRQLEWNRQEHKAMLEGLRLTLDPRV